MTGAPLPPGCDTVVPIEDVEVISGIIHLKGQPELGENVRYCGEELRCGELILDAGTPLFAGEIGFLAAAGIETVLVHPAPRVAILSTGDELVELGSPQGAGQIVNSNAYLLATRLREEGCDPILLGIARDTPGELAAALQRGLQADLLLTTGGVSVGDCDHVQETLVSLGFSRKFWKVAIKPGKPLVFGVAATGALVFGLPGNPVSSMVSFELFARPALRAMLGASAIHRPRADVVLTNAHRKSPGRAHYVRARVSRRGGVLEAALHAKQGSAMLTSMVGVNALVELAAEMGDAPAGTIAPALLLDAI
jgi:molybdopterin molybdotransferase